MRIDRVRFERRNACAVVERCTARADSRSIPALGYRHTSQPRDRGQSPLGPAVSILDGKPLIRIGDSFRMNSQYWLYKTTLTQRWRAVRAVCQNCAQ